MNTTVGQTIGQRKRVARWQGDDSNVVRACIEANGDLEKFRASCKARGLKFLLEGKEATPTAKQCNDKISSTHAAYKAIDPSLPFLAKMVKIFDPDSSGGGGSRVSPEERAARAAQLAQEFGDLVG